MRLLPRLCATSLLLLTLAFTAPAPAFKEVIGWNAIEERQAYYELDAPALKRAA